jgi:amidase
MYFEAMERIKNNATKAHVAYPVDLPPATDLWYEGQNPIDVVLHELCSTSIKAEN